MSRVRHAAALTDLTAWAARAFERAWDHRAAYLPHRADPGKCSREDFAGGYLAALIALGSQSSFTPEARPRLFPPQE